MVELAELDDADVELLQRLIREHEEKTASPRARPILVQWDQFLPLFRKVAPKELGRAGGRGAGRVSAIGSSELELVLARRSA